MKVQITYFKQGGIYHTRVQYDSKLPEHDSSPSQYHEEAKEMIRNGESPGLSDGNHDFFVLIEIPDHHHGYPCLIIPF